MVLQQEMRIPVWGWADPGEKISVTPELAVVGTLKKRGG